MTKKLPPLKPGERPPLKPLPPLKPGESPHATPFAPDGSITIDDREPIPRPRPAPPRTVLPSSADAKRVAAKQKLRRKSRRYCSCGRAVKGNAFAWHVQAGRARGEEHGRVPPPGTVPTMLDGPNAWRGAKPETTLLDSTRTRPDREGREEEAADEEGVDGRERTR